MSNNAALELPSMQATSALLVRLINAANTLGPRDGAADYARGTLEDALALLSASRITAPVWPPRGGLAPWQIKRVAAFVNEHINTSFRAGELAKVVRLSYSHFNRAFKVSFGVTPSSYIMRERIRVAKDKMLATQQPLSQVALECGLCDQAHFSRMFRRVVGQSPRLWRRQFAAY